MPKYYIKTFGCKVNQYESRLISEKFKNDNFTAAQNIADADIIVFNSCTVTAQADRECEYFLRKVLKFPNKPQIYLTGCMAKYKAGYIKSTFPVINVITDKSSLYSNAQTQSVKNFEGRSRAFLKIQDGCDSFCSYCIVPYVRNKLWSKPQDAVISEFENLVKNGYPEIVLTGIHVGKYFAWQCGIRNEEWGINDNGKGKSTSDPQGQCHSGLDPESILSSSNKIKSNVDTRFHGYDKKSDRDTIINFSDLIERIIALPLDFRIRISSIEINEIDEKLIELMKKNPQKICRHLHIPLQSGSDDILKLMNRSYRSGDYKDKINAIMQAMPDLALTTDIITGFPGETDYYHNETLNFVWQIPFARFHIFRYSDRNGTKASQFVNKVSPQIIKKRADALFKIDAEKRKEFLKKFIGTKRQAVKAGKNKALTDNYIVVNSSTQNGIFEVEITDKSVI